MGYTKFSEMVTFNVQLQFVWFNLAFVQVLPKWQGTFCSNYSIDTINQTVDDSSQNDEAIEHAI